MSRQRGDVTSIVWFRQDLRLADNPALVHAAGRGGIVPLYILDETPPPRGRPIGGAQRWWLHHSLEALEASLGGLVLLRGDPRELVPKVAKAVAASGVYWNRCYEPYAIARDRQIKSELSAAGLDVTSFNASLLHEPWEVETGSGGPFKVFSPFWRACARRQVARPAAAPKPTVAAARGLGERLSSWHLLPRRPNWASGWDGLWQPGEAGARKRLDAFLRSDLQGYAAGRDWPDRDQTSHLSPHLHWGELSPRTLWARVVHAGESHPELRKDADKLLSELGWREFSHHLLYHFPELHRRNWRPAFDAYPWRTSKADLIAWQRGHTGYPMVDAGMRELWATGYMHNRMRMVAASFLIKHLRIDWRAGEAWFWDTLVDADLANNAASWQWVAGSGADAAPYFRIFNPVEQGRKFDPEGAYVRRWCPELAALPDKHLHAPFAAPREVLEAAGIELGKTYPKPIVDHAEARRAALEGYDAVKAAGNSEP